MATATKPATRRAPSGKYDRLRAYAKREGPQAAEDVVSALTGLGYSHSEALARVAAADIQPDDDEAAIIAKALRVDPRKVDPGRYAAAAADQRSGTELTADAGPDDLAQAPGRAADLAAVLDERRNETPEQKAAREAAEAQAEAQQAAADKLRAYPEKLWNEAQPSLDRLADKMASGPKPGGIMALVLVLLVFVCFIVPVDATGRYTRFQLLWLAITGKARLLNARKSGPSAPDPAMLTADITKEVEQAAGHLAQVAGAAGGVLGGAAGIAGQIIHTAAPGLFDLTSYTAAGAPPNTAAGGSATSSPPTVTL